MIGWIFLKRIKRKILSLFEKKKETPFFCYEHKELANFEIGRFSYGKPTILFKNPDAKLSIGNYCSIAEGVKIFLGGNHRTDWVTTYPFNATPKEFETAKHIKGHPATKGDVKIGNDVWIGYNVTILSGVSIGDGAVIGAGSIVSKNIKPYEIWVGNPATLVKKRFTDEQINKLLKIKWWNWSEDKVKINFELLCQDDITLFINKHKNYEEETT